jgi:GTP cyclohydrolase I
MKARTPIKARTAKPNNINNIAMKDLVVTYHQKTGIEEHIAEIIKSTGENLSRDGLINTPKRAALAWQFLMQGYTQNLAEIINGATFDCTNNDMVMLTNIEMYSMCEHHLLPFIGKCHIAYLPNKKVLGISKLVRIVEHYSRRLQIQENLTQQIASAIMNVTDGYGVGVIIEAQHFCMLMRGVETVNAVMKTSAMLGSFKDDMNLRKEFLHNI